MKKGVLKREESDEKLLDRGVIILFVVFLVIGIVFYVSLSIIKSGDSRSGTGGAVLTEGEKGKFSFGIEEILFSLVFAFLMVGFLLWTKSISIKNAYLGSCIGLLGLGILAYAFYLRYRGPYSNVFMIATGLVVVVYLGINFFKYKKGDNKEEFDEV